MLDERKVRNMIIGKRSKASGAFFEKMIDAGCQEYERQGVAKIEKQQEPVHYIRPYGKAGQFIANYAKKSGVDYKGTVSGGRAVCFEAKHTDGDRMQQDRVQPHQMEYLNAHDNLGASCFILVSFGLTDFFRVPLSTWQRMKETYGRKYVTREDLALYRIKNTGNVLHFLYEEEFR